MQNIEKNHHERAKKEAKRLLMLARETNGSIPVATLAQAQKAIAFLRGKLSWHELETAALRPAHGQSASTSADDAQAEGLNAVEIANIIAEHLEKKMADASVAHRATAITTSHLGATSGKLRRRLSEKLSDASAGIECSMGDGVKIWLPLLGSPSGSGQSIQWLAAKPDMRGQALLRDALLFAGKLKDPRSFVSFSTTNALDDSMREACQGGEVVFFKQGRDGKFPKANPFDTLPGARIPSSTEREALLTLLMGACQNRPMLHSILGFAIDTAYVNRAKADGATPYHAGLVADVDQALATLGLSPATWWEASDALGQAGLERQAWRAQARAMPTLEDAILAIQAPECPGDLICVGSGEPAKSAAMSDLRQCMARHPEMAGASEWAPSMNLRGISFNLTNRSDPEGLGMGLRFLWARKISQRWMPALAGAGALGSWQEIDVGADAGSSLRRRHLAAMFKKAGKAPKCATVIDNMPRWQWGAIEEALFRDMEQARSSGNAMTVLSTSKQKGLLMGLVNLSVEAKGLAAGSHRLEVLAEFDEVTIHGECFLKSTPAEAWAASAFASDRELVAAAKRHKDPTKALAAIFAKYPAGSWHQEAEARALDLPWDALSAGEQQALADQEVAEATRG